MYWKIGDLITTLNQLKLTMSISVIFFRLFTKHRQHQIRET